MSRSLAAVGSCHTPMGTHTSGYRTNEGVNNPRNLDGRWQTKQLPGKCCPAAGVQVSSLLLPGKTCPGIFFRQQSMLDPVTTKLPCASQLMQSRSPSSPTACRAAGLASAGLLNMTHITAFIAACVEVYIVCVRNVLQTCSPGRFMSMHINEAEPCKQQRTFHNDFNMYVHRTYPEVPQCVPRSGCSSTAGG